ncbi:MurR/RpiR family transcriptional regulator [Enterococcus italicus]|uniref:MurR/RpiR family transcriptional regulator n=1 Tax=Enterococcus italicus TaxID=246144 RepID=UPI003F47990B
MDVEVLIKGNQITETDKKILNYLDTNIYNLDGISLKELSTRLYTSPATIVRLAQKLGFSGYLELFYFLKNNQTNITLKNSNNLDISSFKESIDGLKSIYTENKNKLIIIYATGFSSIAGEYFNKKLLVNGVSNLFVDAADSSGIIQNNFRNISMLALISKSGETQKTIEKMNFAKEKKIPTILFTGNQSSRAAKQADYTFFIPDNNALDTQNIYYTEFFGNLILLLEGVIQELTK